MENRPSKNAFPILQCYVRLVEDNPSAHCKWSYLEVYTYTYIWSIYRSLKVTVWSPSWRSRNHLQGDLTIIPTRLQRIARYMNIHPNSCKWDSPLVKQVRPTTWDVIETSQKSWEKFDNLSWCIRRTRFQKINRITASYPSRNCSGQVGIYYLIQMISKWLNMKPQLHTT